MSDWPSPFGRGPLLARVIDPSDSADVPGDKPVYWAEELGDRRAKDVAIVEFLRIG